MLPRKVLKKGSKKASQESLETDGTKPSKKHTDSNQSLKPVTVQMKEMTEIAM